MKANSSPSTPMMKTKTTTMKKGFDSPTVDGDVVDDDDSRVDRDYWNGNDFWMTD